MAPSSMTDGLVSTLMKGSHKSCEAVVTVTLYETRIVHFSRPILRPGCSTFYHVASLLQRAKLTRVFINSRSNHFQIFTCKTLRFLPIFFLLAPTFRTDDKAFSVIALSQRVPFPKNKRMPSTRLHLEQYSTKRLNNLLNRGFKMPRLLSRP